MSLDLSGNTISYLKVSSVNSALQYRILRQGLGVYLDAADVDCYTGGTVSWIDKSGLGNYCVWNTAPTYNSGGYFTFNGTSHYGTITANGTALDFSAAQTLIIVYRKSANASRQNPWNQAYGGFGTWTCETDGTVSGFFGNAGSDTTPYIGTASAAITLNVWNFMCTTRDTNVQSWYKNGTQGLVTQNPYGKLASTGANILIGNGYAGYFAGDIAMIIAYIRALQPYEVSEIFQAVRGRFSL